MPYVYNPDLETKPGYNPVEVPDDEGLLRQLAETGWGTVEPPVQTDPALAAEQPDVVYQAVNPEPAKPAKAAAKKTAAKDTDT